MNLTQFNDIHAFYQRAEGYLLSNEAAHCLTLGLCSSLLRQPERAASHYLALVEEQGNIVATAVRTPSYPVVLSRFSSDALAPEAIRLFVEDLRAVGAPLEGIHAPNEIARVFAAQWQRATGASYRMSRQERIYALEQVQPVDGVAGTMRHPTAADRDLIVRWAAAFTAEALDPDDVDDIFDAETWTDEILSTPGRGMYLWQTDQPVTMVGFGGLTPHGIRIGPVYTPPEQRRHGYASACTAQVSQALLDEGRAFVFLFTDLSNPTSNHIYQVIGYRPIQDVEVYKFPH